MHHGAEVDALGRHEGKPVAEIETELAAEEAQGAGAGPIGPAHAFPAHAGEQVKVLLHRALACPTTAWPHRRAPSAPTGAGPSSASPGRGSRGGHRAPGRARRDTARLRSRQEQPGHGHPGARPAGEPPEYREQSEPLEPRLVELARMPRLRAGAGEDHRPRDVRRLAPQLAVDEVSDAPAPSPGGTSGARKSDTRKNPRRCRRANHAAAAPPRAARREKTSPPPRSERRPGDRRGSARNRRRAHSRCARRAPRPARSEHEVVDLRRRPAAPGFTGGTPPAEPPSDPDPGNVGEAIPADRHRPDGDGDGIDLGYVSKRGSARQAASSLRRDDSRFTPREAPFSRSQGSFGPAGLGAFRSARRGELPPPAMRGTCRAQVRFGDGSAGRRRR